jgi:hypothetical protein
MMKRRTETESKQRKHAKKSPIVLNMAGAHYFSHVISSEIALARSSLVCFTFTEGTVAALI